MSTLFNPMQPSANQVGASVGSSGKRSSARFVLAAAFGFALLSPLVAGSALAQTETTTTVAEATTTAAGTDSTLVANEVTPDTTVVDGSIVSDEPEGGVDAGFGGAADAPGEGIAGPALVAAGITGAAAVWMVRRRNVRRSIQ